MTHSRKYGDSHSVIFKSYIMDSSACNSGTGKLNSFAQKLADVTDTKVVGMIGDGVAVVSRSLISV
ncbi:MAG: hypothetical protein L3J23_04055 [Flavobacteriaceae bacterium]|nr:hypothetical protein [Flavobacteriaceae bacterium]